MQPRKTQVPPMRLASTIATLAPCPAARRLPATPPEPAPIVRRSKSYFAIEATDLPFAGRDYRMGGPPASARSPLFASKMVSRYILCDLDGTLVDSAPDLTAALNRLLAASDRKSLDQPTVRR